MTWFQALVLGLVEGLTEYLPVSSTGHLLLAQRVLGIPRSPAADAYAICIQAGAILAVLGLYRARVAQMLQGVIGRDPAGRRLAIQLAVAFVPAAVIGFLFNDRIDDLLFGLWPIVFAWTVGGAAIFLLRGRSGGRALEALDLRTALLIGCCQCLALWPGTSRSLATILGGVLLGVSLPAAVEFSFLLGLLTLGAATSYSALKHGDEMLAAFGMAPLIIGFVASAVAAAVSVKWLVAWLQSHGLEVFAVWRIGLAGVVAVLLTAGVLVSG
ncbi:MAG: undecaprenyl-diphosphate phosphatase [Pseudomonadota bacterium]|nr:undecaprenyl-diphosphate phosphatase [Pseudomonadota bacterium]